MRGAVCVWHNNVRNMKYLGENTQIVEYNDLGAGYLLWWDQPLMDLFV